MNPIGILKNFCTLNFLFKVKYLLHACTQKELQTTQPSKRIFYLDAPDYANIGDQAIAFAIEKFAHNHFPEYEFIEVLQKDVAGYMRSLKKQINRDDLIFLTGGGNMGNVYKMFEATRRIIINAFPNNRIVVFPQTIDYTSDIFGTLSCKHSKKVYSAHKDLILCTREEFSYEKAKSLYPNVHVVLCPDIVLSLDKTCEENRTQCVSICLRDDCERVLSQEEQEKILSTLNDEALPFREVSTISSVKTIINENRERIVLDKLKDFSRSKFAITDRLHAMIFCFLTNTPCIVFGNSNCKIKGVYKFLEDVAFIRFMDNIDDLQNAVRDLKAVSSVQGKELDFSALLNAIRKG